MHCPLCSGSNTRLQDSLRVADIISRWKSVHSISLDDEFGDVTVVDLHKCFQCELTFFTPPSVAGSAKLYEELEKREWYYMPRKWEHDAALEDIDGARNGFEIGCGFGSFVARVIDEKHIPFEGCELNPSAVKVGSGRGVPIRLESFEEVAHRCPQAYDAVCAFQVLEHLSDPRAFFISACQMLRPGGKLIFGVPNAKSSIVRYLKFFDAPPHHMTRWSNDVLLHLSKWFPLKLVRLVEEPLQNSSVEIYLEAYEELLKRNGAGFLMHPWIRSRSLRLLRNPRILSVLTGETLYACYVRA